MTEGHLPQPRSRGRATVAGVAEILLVAAGLTLIVSYRFFVPIWQAGSGLVALGLLTSAAYMVARLAPGGSDRAGPGRAILIALVVSQPVLALLWILDLNVSRPVLVGELGLLFLGIWAASSRIGTPVRAAVALAFAGLAAIPTLLGIVRPVNDVPAGPTQEYLFSSYHDLSITTYAAVDDDGQEGGALTLLPDGRMLLVTGGGFGHLLDFEGGLETSAIELGLPIDVAGYRATGRRLPMFYRVFDAVFHEGHLFVSHIHWDPEADCYSVRLLESEFDGTTVGSWTTRFASRPCLPLAFTPNTSGGRIGVLDGSRLLLTLGTFTTEGEDLEPETSDYGKIIELDTETWTPKFFTTGHRNPEGLLVVGDTIWSTEHGPHGGDELNLVEAGSNYGWPFVSYGTDYGKKMLERGAAPGDHSNFVAPIHAWTPSVGISNLIRVSDGIFPMWRDDLLIGSLSGLGNGHSLFRVRLLNGRAVNIERLAIGSRVRDLIQLPGGGPVVVWDGRGAIQVIRPADLVFSQCAGCHGIRNAQHGIGPDLFGVVGGPVGRHDGFDYSDGLRNYGGVWTPDRLDRFLAAPQSEVPGTSMDFEGVADPSERAEIIQFLSEISGGRTTP